MTRNMPFLAWAAVSAVCWLGTTTPCWGYQLQQVEGGNYVKWHQQVITYRIHSQGVQDLPLEPLTTAIRDSFDTWQRGSQEKVVLQFGGHSQAQGAGYDDNQATKNENVVLWENKQWPYPNGAIAMTLVTYRMYSGQIVDADIVLNGVNFRWMIKSTSSSTPTYPLASDISSHRKQLPAIDLANTVTHEAGHFLGLGHSENADATMYAHQSAEEIKKRHLHLDDLNGILKLYDSPETVTQTKTLLPKLPPPPDGMGCSVYLSPPREWPFVFFVVAFGCAFVYQRKRKEPRDFQ